MFLEVSGFVSYSAVAVEVQVRLNRLHMSRKDCWPVFWMMETNIS